MTIICTSVFVYVARLNTYARVYNTNKITRASNMV